MTDKRGASFDEYWRANANEPIYIILGVQGSGTNFLGRLLVRTFGFSLLRDRSMVFKVAAKLRERPSAKEIRRAFATVQSRVFPSMLARKTRNDVILTNRPFVGLEEAFEKVEVANGADLERLVCAYGAFSSGTGLMLLKSDDLWEHIDVIDRVLPNRRVILLTRDFRDNLVSVSGKHFGPIEPICAAEYVKYRFGFYEREYQRAGGAGYHVRFETVLEAPEVFLKDFAQRFGLTFARDPEDVVAAFKFRPNKVGKFKRLPVQQRAWCEALLRDELKRYDYPLEFEVGELPGQLTRLSARITDALKRAPQKVRTLYRRLAR